MPSTSRVQQVSGTLSNGRARRSDRAGADRGRLSVRCRTNHRCIGVYRRGTWHTSYHTAAQAGMSPWRSGLSRRQPPPQTHLIGQAMKSDRAYSRLSFHFAQSSSSASVLRWPMSDLLSRRQAYMFQDGSTGHVPATCLAFRRGMLGVENALERHQDVVAHTPPLPPKSFSPWEKWENSSLVSLDNDLSIVYNDYRQDGGAFP